MLPSASKSIRSAAGWLESPASCDVAADRVDVASAGCNRSSRTGNAPSLRGTEGLGVASDGQVRLRDDDRRWP